MPESMFYVNPNLSENVEYNSDVLPVKARYCLQSWYPNRKAPCHWHSDIECIYVIEGSMTYFVNDMQYHIRQGEGIFVNANRLHFCQCEPGEDCYYIVLLLGPSCLVTNPAVEAKFINPVIFENASDALVLHPYGWHNDALKLIQQIFEKMHAGETPHILSIMQDIYAFWDLFYQDTLSKLHPDANTARMDSLKEMITYIQIHYRERLSLADIAASGMMCESKCCSIFKSALHQSPVAYLNAYRVRISLALLAGTGKSITEIALSCGFNSSSYYAETFQRIMKMSPRQYRKSKRV